MWLRKIRISNFKNHTKLEHSLPKGWVCITGPNGVGKTNVLDAIWYLANSRSYFNNIDQQLVRHGSPGFSLKAEFESEIPVEVSCRLEVGKRKQLLLNDVPVRKLSQYLGTVPVVMITPFDIALVLDGGEERRKFMDVALCKVYPEYLTALDKYKKALESRNKQLKMFAKKGSQDTELLDAFNVVLIETAPVLFDFRKKLIEEISLLFNPIYQKLSGDKEFAEIVYRSQLEEHSMEDWLSMQLQKDIILERTTKGCHQDDLDFLIHKHHVKKFGSQGQTKSFVIALQLALFEWMRDKKGIVPILLLDDIYEKIDAKRSESLMQIIHELSPEQVFVTDTHKERVQQNITQFEGPHFFWDM
ncbi:MAG: DNA replication and repair protein RecF [Bacteroidetes bacterium]|nr:DNA replication and repair protein RecF [Bacteroidota bacterium]